MIFSVSVLLHTSPKQRPDEHELWEEQILLISADSEEDARSQAEEIGRRQEFDYESADGRMLVTRFACVERTFQIAENLTELKEGTELFSRFLRDSEARSLLQPFDD